MRRSRDNRAWPAVGIGAIAEYQREITQPEREHEQEDARRLCEPGSPPACRGRHPAGRPGRRRPPGPDRHRDRLACHRMTAVAVGPGDDQSIGPVRHRRRTAHDGVPDLIGQVGGRRWGVVSREEALDRLNGDRVDPGVGRRRIDHQPVKPIVQTAGKFVGVVGPVSPGHRGTPLWNCATWWSRRARPAGGRSRAPARS